MTTKRSSRIEIGAILKVTLSEGLAYVQSLGKHAEYGDVIYVFNKTFREELDCLESLLQVDGFIAFYSATISVRNDFTKVVGTLPRKTNLEIPRRLRRAGARGAAGEIHTWIIEENGTEVVVRQLSEEQLKLPIAAIWDHELLKMRIVEGWSPEKVGTSR